MIVTIVVSRYEYLKGRLVCYIIEKPLKGYKTRIFDMFEKTALNVSILIRRTILA